MHYVRYIFWISELLLLPSLKTTQYIRYTNDRRATCSTIINSKYAYFEFCVRYSSHDDPWERLVPPHSNEKLKLDCRLSFFIKDIKSFLLQAKKVLFYTKPPVDLREICGNLARYSPWFNIDTSTN